MRGHKRDKAEQQDRAKWKTTGLMKVLVAMLRSGVRKLAPIETATNNSATSAADEVPSSM
jgi:hypothetical protein